MLYEKTAVRTHLYLADVADRLALFRQDLGKTTRHILQPFACGLAGVSLDKGVNERECALNERECSKQGPQDGPAGRRPCRQTQCLQGGDDHAYCADDAHYPIEEEYPEQDLKRVVPAADRPDDVLYRSPEPFEILADGLPIRIVFDPGVNVFDPIADPAGNSVPVFVNQIANIVDQDFQIGRHETENGRAKLPHYVAQPRPCPPKILCSLSLCFRYGFRRSLGLHLS